ncbi:hypothetical protein AB0L30_14450 [Microbispora rosea]|uniref:hypothetical protein n=1 Tax=Microbispora rosea TaxID=58117 RepID=UPI00341A6B09
MFSSDQGVAGDSLKVNGTELLNPANTPRSKRAIGLFAYDAGVDRVTDLGAPIPQFFAQPFLSGMDVFLPAGRSAWSPRRAAGAASATC